MLDFGVPVARYVLIRGAEPRYKTRDEPRAEFQGKRWAQTSHRFYERQVALLYLASRISNLASKNVLSRTKQSWEADTIMGAPRT